MVKAGENRADIIKGGRMVRAGENRGDILEEKHIVRGGENRADILKGRCNVKNPQDGEVGILPVDCINVNRPVDAVQINNTIYYLNIDGSIITDKKFIITNSNSLKLTKLALFYGRLYGISSGKIYVLDSSSFENEVWKWVAIRDWPTGIIDITTTTDGQLLWITTSQGGYSVTSSKRIKKKTNRPYIRRYAREKHQYVEFTGSGIAREYKRGEVIGEYSNIRDGCYDHNNKLHLITTKNSSYAIRLLRDKITYL
jgi:hypothetical protein